MEEVFKVCIFGIIATILILFIKNEKPEIAILLTISASVLIIIFALGKISYVFSILERLVTGAGINKDFLKIILKVTVIAYVIEFGKDVCIDAGQSSIANKLEMAGKVIIVSLSFPIISSLVEILTGLV